MSKSIAGKFAKGKIQSIATEFIAGETAKGIDKGNDQLTAYALNNQDSFAGHLAENLAEGSEVTQKGLEYIADPAKLDNDLNPILSKTQESLQKSAVQNFEEGNSFIATYQEGASEFIEGFKDGVKIVTKPLEGTEVIGDKLTSLGKKMQNYGESNDGFLNLLAGDIGGGIENVGATFLWGVNTTKQVKSGLKELVNTIKDTPLMKTKPADYESYSNSIAQENILDTYNATQRLALLNQHSYFDDPSYPLPKNIKQLMVDGQPLEVHHDEGSNYDARVFINEQTKEIIVVHRGSQEIKDWMEDGKIAMGKAPDEQVADALAFNQKVQEVVSQQYPDYNVIQSGHSLGGFHAQVIGAINGQTAVTFDSPGTKEYLEQLYKQGKISPENYNAIPENITTIQGPATLVGQAGTQPGNIINILPPPGDNLNQSFTDSLMDIAGKMGDRELVKILALARLIYNPKDARTTLEQVIKILQASARSESSLLSNTANFHPNANYWKYFTDPACQMVDVEKWTAKNTTISEALYGDINTGAITKIGTYPPKPFDKKLTLTQDKSIVVHAQKIAKRAQMLTKTIGLK